MAGAFHFNAVLNTEDGRTDEYFPSVGYLRPTQVNLRNRSTPLNTENKVMSESYRNEWRTRESRCCTYIMLLPERQH